VRSWGSANATSGVFGGPEPDQDRVSGVVVEDDVDDVPGRGRLDGVEEADELLAVRR
jgi:hypothetical protein